MMYVAINRTTRSAFDLHQGRWVDVMQVHPELVRYRAKAENLKETLSAALYDRSFSDLGHGLEATLVETHAARLAVFRIEEVYDHDTAINKFPQFTLVGSVNDDMQLRIDNSTGMKLINLLDDYSPPSGPY